MRRPTWTLLVLVAFAAPIHAATSVALCDLVADPAAYDRQVIEIAAFVSHGFENFTLFDPRCAAELPRVWLEYGGRFASGTIYCCGVGDERAREAPLVVEGVGTTIVQDANLKQFDQLIQREPDSVVHATVRGRFFAGEKRDMPGGTFWTGYGHFGLFSLLIIERVVSVDAQRLRNIDYRAFPDQPSVDGVGCFSKSLGEVDYSAAIENQQHAEAGELAWTFTDPVGVATAYLRKMSEEKSGLRLSVFRKARGRIVYEAAAEGDRNKYWVVVSRPYWMTFFATDRRRVAWVPIAAYEWGCDGKEN